VQIIPELAKRVSELTVYQRTPIWVMPKIDFGFSPTMQRLFARMPFTQRIVRWFTDITVDAVMVLAMWKYRYFKGLNIGASALSTIHRFLSIRDKELRHKLTPDYDFGCKRPTMSNTYYRTFTRPHVHLENSGIERIEPDGVVGCDGTKRFIDTLVLATGFDVWDVNLPAIEVIGREGRDLGKWWRDNKFQAYEGVSVPYFPNFLTLASPYAWVGLSWFNTVEYQMRHMNRLLGEVQRRGGRTFEVTEQANARFLAQMTELLDDSVFHLGNCVTSRSYWFNHTGEAPLFRPTSVNNAVKEQLRFPLSDYAIA
jgi:cation diffusion facilitator CzcD-associated flavoprotein CzcO